MYGMPSEDAKKIYPIGTAIFRMPVKDIGGVLESDEQPLYRIDLNDAEAELMRPMTDRVVSLIRHDGERYYILVVGLRAGGVQ